MAVRLLKTGKEYYMPDNIKNKGLCLTCNNNFDCKFINNHNMLVWQCEEYDGKVMEIVEQSNKKEMKKTHSDTDFTYMANSNNKETRKFIGLCVNCENRFSCTHEKVAAGTWHCEDYQ